MRGWRGCRERLGSALRQRHDPVEEINHVTILSNHALGIVTSAEQSSRFIGEIALGEKAAHGQRQWLKCRAGESRFRTRRKDNPFAQRLAAIQRLSDD